MPQATYQVRVSGVIPPEILCELHGLTVSVEPPVTVLQGSLPDQSAVVGLIARVHAHGLRQIEVRWMRSTTDQQTARERRQAG
jgi:hypothetical protein